MIIIKDYKRQTGKSITIRGQAELAARNGIPSMILVTTQNECDVLKHTFGSYRCLSFMVIPIENKNPVYARNSLSMIETNKIKMLFIDECFTIPEYFQELLIKTHDNINANGGAIDIIGYGTQYAEREFTFKHFVK